MQIQCKKPLLAMCKKPLLVSLPLAALLATGLGACAHGRLLITSTTYTKTFTRSLTPQRSIAVCTRISRTCMRKSTTVPIMGIGPTIGTPTTAVARTIIDPIR
jgi:hypothetical protein